MEQELDEYGNPIISEEEAEVDGFGNPIISETQTDPQTAAQSTDAISTQMYEGKNFSEAMEQYNSIIEGPNITKPPLGFIGYAVYNDPATGRREYIPRPNQKMFGKNGMFDNATDMLAGLFTGDLDRASTAFDDTEANVSTTSKLLLGGSESLGDFTEAAAAGLEVAGLEGAVDFVEPLAPKIDTGDNIVDTILTDAVPAVALAFTGGAAAQQIVKSMPRVIRGFGILLGGELGATATVGTEEGTMFLGKGDTPTLFPIAAGIDLGDSEAEAILEQRFNTLSEGMLLNSTIAGLALTAVQVAKLVSKFAITPFLNMASDAAIESRIYNSITDQLVKIDLSSTKKQVADAKLAIADIIERNKTILVPKLTNLVENVEVPIDTISALLKGTNDPEGMARISGVRAGQIQKGSTAAKTIAASERPALELQGQMDELLTEVGGDTATDQVATIAKSADELATDARAAINTSDVGATGAQNTFDEAAQKVVDNIKNADLEIGGTISRLEDVTGTNIVTGKEASFEQIRSGLMTAKETMTKTKDDLYLSVPEGTPFDYGGFAAAVDDAVQQIDLLDSSGTRTKSVELINTIRLALKPREVVQEGASVPFGVRQDVISVVDGADLATELLEGGVDFRTLYTRVRPEIATLIDQAYKRGDNAVAIRLIEVKKAIDLQVDWVAKNSDADAADAAKAAYGYYKDTYAPIWRSGGAIQEFGDMYQPVLTRGTGQAGFMEDSRSLVTAVLQGNNADAVLNMRTALEQVSDPKPIADYMITDVINGFASSVRQDGMTPETLKSMSSRLAQYAESLNTAFPERAAQINRLIASIEEAGGNKTMVESALKQAEEVATQTRKDVKSSELGKFLSNIYGRELDTTLNPEAAFLKIFREAEGIGTIQDILARLDDMPAARSRIIRDGMETSFLRHLGNRINGAKMQSGGALSLKGANADSILTELNNTLDIGRAVFSKSPEMMETIETLLDAARIIEKQKQASPVASMSPTAFNQEAVQATNRLIMTFIGPLTRLGARVGALSGAVFDKLDSTQRAAKIMDNMLANPDYFLELARKYNRYPMDPLVEENLITALTAGATKGINAEVEYMYDQNNVDQQMMELVPQ